MVKDVRDGPGDGDSTEVRACIAACLQVDPEVCEYLALKQHAHDHQRRTGSATLARPEEQPRVPEV